MIDALIWIAHEGRGISYVAVNDDALQTGR